MTCHNCKIETKKDGKDRKGNQRYRCNQCKRRFQEERDRLIGNMYLSEEKSLMVLRLLLEGNSIRSIERITGIEKKTITRVLLNAGEHCEQLMERKIKGIAVKDVEADEIWGFVNAKIATNSTRESPIRKLAMLILLSALSATPSLFSRGILASVI